MAGVGRDTGTCEGDFKRDAVRSALPVSVAGFSFPHPPSSTGTEMSGLLTEGINQPFPFPSPVDATGASFPHPSSSTEIRDQPPPD